MGRAGGTRCDLFFLLIKGCFEALKRGFGCMGISYGVVGQKKS